MNRWGRAGRGKRQAAAVLAFLLFISGLWGMAVGQDVLRQAGQRIAQAVKKKVLRDAVGAVSPLVGYLLRLEEEPDKKENQKEPTAKEPGEREIWQELEQLLLAEQSETPANSKTPGDSETPDNSEALGDSHSPDDSVPAGAGGDVADPAQTPAPDTGPEAIAGTENLFPEDGEEEGMRMEIDADLLAEIDRENQALRDLAFQQTQVVTPPAAAEAGQLPAPAYSTEQLSSLDFLIHNFYNVHKSTVVDEALLNAAAMQEQDMSLQNPDSEGPKVLIHHTHATEYFADSDPEDPSTLIVGVGDYLEELLETQYGIEVLHDRTVYPYNEAYSQALQNVEQILAENPTIEVFIDLHRDAAGANKYTVEIDGKEMANIMFFNGLSRNINGPIEYLANENLAGNLAFSFQLKLAGDSLYPGLCKRNYLKSYRYNLHVLSRAVIIEVGDNNNTLEEAKNAMEPLARILAYVLNGS